jgi:hypothetical protein
LPCRSIVGFQPSTEVDWQSQIGHDYQATQTCLEEIVAAAIEDLQVR